MAQSQVTDKTAENLDRLSKDSYDEAYDQLKRELENANKKETMSIVRLEESTENYVKVRSIRDKVQQGNYLDHKEAMEVGLLKIS